MIAASRISKAAVVKSRSVARVQSTIVCNQSGGFGKVSSKPKDTSMKLSKKIEKELGIAREATGQLKAKQGVPSASAASQGVDVKKGWKDCGETSEIFAKKDKQVVELAAGKAILVYLYKGKVYTTDAYSTAYQYPLFDAKVYDSTESGRPVVEVPLDGTIYDLETGKVELWCPNDGSIVRSVLGALKKTSDPIDLKIYRNVVADGRVYVQFYEGEY